MIRNGALVAETQRRDADIDADGAIALMRNRFLPDFTAIPRVGDVVDAYPPPATRNPQPEERCP